MNYTNKYLISDFYSNENLKCILTVKRIRDINNLLEVKLGKNRRVLKLENIDIKEINLIIWYKNDANKIFYNTFIINPIEIDSNHFFTNIKEFIENYINEALILGTLTITNFKKYPTRFDFDCCENGLIIKKKYWLDCNCFKVDCFLNETINGTTINHISYQSIFDDMHNFYLTLQNYLNNSYSGSLLDILDYLQNITEFVQIENINLYFDDYSKNNKIGIYIFSLVFEVNAKNIKKIIHSLIGAKDETQVNDEIIKMKKLGLL